MSESTRNIARRVRRRRWRNALQSLALLGATAVLLWLLGWMIAGWAGVLWMFGLGVVLMSMSVKLARRLAIRVYRARLLSRRDAPQLMDLVSRLAARAGLALPPRLYYVPSRVLNAFTTGTRDDSALVITDGLLRTMGPRELAGVLAHEISHIRNGDMLVMSLADTLGRMARSFAFVGYILVIANIPLAMAAEATVPWYVIVLLILSPTVSVLMQLALSRSREYDADLGAVDLTGDPRGLASALAKLERFQNRLVPQVLLSGRLVREPSLLRTHPVNEERIRRLLELESDEPVEPIHDHLAPPGPAVVTREPRWHWNGAWY